MKGITTLSFIALIYLALIIIFKEASGEPRGVQNEDNVKQDSGAHAQKQPLYLCIGCDSKSKQVNQTTGTKNASSVAPSLREAIFGNATTDQVPSLKASVPNTTKSSSKVPSQPNQRAAMDMESNQKNDTNPLADLFQITDPTMRTTLNAVYGAYRGSDECTRKAFCMMGNYMKDMPGRDLVFLMMGGYVPAEYSLYYDIFKASVFYGQNCHVYVCHPTPAPEDDNNISTSATRPQPNNKLDLPASFNEIPR